MTWPKNWNISHQKNLIDRLDNFMGYPKYDPHGDPIPDSKGKFKAHELKPVSAC